MRKLVSPAAGKILEIKVAVGQEIAAGDEVLVMQAIDGNGARRSTGGSARRKAPKAGEEHHHHMYEYTCNESLDLLAMLISDSQVGEKEDQ